MGFELAKVKSYKIIGEYKFFILSTKEDKQYYIREDFLRRNLGLDKKETVKYRCVKNALFGIKENEVVKKNGISYVNTVYAGNPEKTINLYKEEISEDKVYNSIVVYVDRYKAILSVKSINKFIHITSKDISINPDDAVSDLLVVGMDVNLFLTEVNNKRYLKPASLKYIKRALFNDIYVGKIYHGTILNYKNTKNPLKENFKFAFVLLDNGLVIMANLLYKNKIVSNSKEVYVQINAKDEETLNILANVVAS